MRDRKDIKVFVTFKWPIPEIPKVCSMERTLVLQNIALYEKESGVKSFKMIQNTCQNIKSSEKFCRKVPHLTFV